MRPLQLVFEEQDIPSLSNKVALVTGASSGIGLEIAGQLALHGAQVFLACRDVERGYQAIEFISTRIPGARVTLLYLDLGELESVKKCVKNFLGQSQSLDLLVNNAGIMAGPYELTVDGVEKQMQVNHLGHFYLTYLLAPALIRSNRKPTTDPARIVFTTSQLHQLGGVFKPELYTQPLPEDTSFYAAVRIYAQTKLANLQCARLWAEKLEPFDILVNAVHPGWVETELHRSLSHWAIRAIYSCFTWMLASPVEEGALTALFAATSPKVAELRLSGKYFIPLVKSVEGAALSRNTEEQKKLWQWSWETVERAVAEAGLAEVDEFLKDFKNF